MKTKHYHYSVCLGFYCGVNYCVNQKSFSTLPLAKKFVKTFLYRFNTGDYALPYSTVSFYRCCREDGNFSHVYVWRNSTHLIDADFEEFLFK